MPKVIGFDEDAKRKKTCRKCAAIVEFVNADLHTIKVNMDYLGDYDLAEAVTCPNCGNNIVV